MLNWQLSLPSLRRCKSEKSDRVPYPGEPPKHRQCLQIIGLDEQVSRRPWHGHAARNHSSRRARNGQAYPARASSSVWPSKPLHVITRQFIERQNPRMKTANYKVKLTLYGRRSFQRRLLRPPSDCDNASKRTFCQNPPDCVASIPSRHE
jgi:hypothetical protein